MCLICHCATHSKYFIFSPNNLARQVLFISVFIDETSETKDWPSHQSHHQLLIEAWANALIIGPVISQHGSWTHGTGITFTLSLGNESLDGSPLTLTLHTPHAPTHSDFFREGPGNCPKNYKKTLNTVYLFRVMGCGNVWPRELVLKSEDNLQELSSPLPAMWVPEIELRPQGLAASTFTCFWTNHLASP